MTNILKYTSGLLFAIGFVACSNLDESELKISTDGKVLYSETFSTSQGDFTTYSVKGDQNWTFSSTYSCMVISGFVSPTNYENEDWLISPEVDLGDYTTSHVSFEHAGNYFASVSNSVSVWVSENYVTGTRPDSASWTQIEITKNFSNSDFTFVTPEISLTQFAGKKVRIALKYISTASKAGTWEVKNFKVTSGEAVPVPVVNNGKGTELLPYNVAGASQATGTSAWVNAYIVGYLWSGTYTNYVLGADTCTQATNLMIADTTGNIYFAKCMAVQLPTGVIRNALNLVTPANKTLIGKKVRLYGSIESYFGAPGIKNVSYVILPDSTAVGTKPVEPIYSETFASNSQGSFTINNVLLPAGFSSIWLTSSSYGMVATAFKSSTNYASEGWLISPEIDLTNQTTAKLKFDHAINYVTIANMKNEMSVHISTDSGTSWTPLTVPVYPTGSNWTFVNSGEINLQAYIGQKIKIAFKYMSTTTKAGTWEVKNFVVYK